MPVENRGTQNRARNSHERLSPLIDYCSMQAARSGRLPMSLATAPRLELRTDPTHITAALSEMEIATDPWRRHACQLVARRSEKRLEMNL